jgi:hypothetical protein
LNTNSIDSILEGLKEKSDKIILLKELDLSGNGNI